MVSAIEGMGALCLLFLGLVVGGCGGSSSHPSHSIVDSGPQPFPRLERTVEEAAQVFGGPRLVAAPEHVPGLGLDGDWFPARDAVMSSDGVRLITTTVVDWKGASQARQRTLAVAVTRPFLGRSRTKLAEYGES